MKQTQPPAEQLSRCPTCNTGLLRDKLVTERFEFEVDGKTKTIVAENVPVSECDNTACGERLSGPDAARIRHEAICRTFGLLTPSEIQAIRERLGLSQERFAQLTGLGVATISRLERGRLLQNRAMDNYLRLVERTEENIRFLEERQDGEQPLDPSANRIIGSFRGLKDQEAVERRKRRIESAQFHLPPEAETEARTRATQFGSLRPPGLPSESADENAAPEIPSPVADAEHLSDT